VILPTRGSLAVRLSLGFAAATAAILAALAAALDWGLARSLEGETRRFLASEIDEIRAALSHGVPDVATLRAEIENEASGSPEPPFYLRVLDPRGAVLAEMPGMVEQGLSAEGFPEPEPAAAEWGSGRVATSPRGRRFRMYALKIPTAAGSVTVQAAVDLTANESLLDRFRRFLRGVVLAALGASALVGWGVARRGLAPLRTMEAAVRTIDTESLGYRIDPEGMPTEVRALAEAFNRMLGHLEGAFERLSQFSADIAHELRTPLANLRGELEVGLSRRRSLEDYRDLLGSCLEECDRLARLIDSLLFVARAERAEGPMTREPVSLAEELGRIGELYGAAAAEAGLALSVSAADDVVVEGDRVLLQRAIGNLVENAIHWTPSGGRVTLTASAAGELARIEVSDTGPGIPPEHLPRVFDRLYRADPARSAHPQGAGLGLAIVRSVARLHGGAAAIESRPGQGTSVVLTLPRAAVSPALRDRQPDG
jgi:two-component system heavy metal sensor histidine kinase CusS